MSRREGVPALLEELWLARTPQEREAVAQRHFGGRATVEAVARMRSILTFVVALAEPGQPVSSAAWRHLEKLAAVLAGAPSTMRSAEDAVAPTLPAETEVSPPLWPASSPRVEEAPSMARSIIARAVSQVDDVTLQGGKAPVKPAVLVRKLLDEGETHRALEIYAALCAETEAAPERRPRIHVIFGLMTEAQRRALDHRFESLFDADAALRAMFESRVERLTSELRGMEEEGR